MTDGIETARELATHASDIEHLQDDMDAIKEDLAAIRKSIEEINKQLASAQGGLRVLMWLGGASSVVFGAIAGHFSSKGL